MKKRINYPPMDPLQVKQLTEIVTHQIEKELMRIREENCAKTYLPRDVDSTINNLEQLFCYTFKRNKDERNKI